MDVVNERAGEALEPQCLVDLAWRGREGCLAHLGGGPAVRPPARAVKDGNALRGVEHVWSLVRPPVYEPRSYREKAMRTLSRTGLAAGLILAVSGATNAVYGGSEKFFVSGNITNCTDAFAALESQHPIDFPAGTFGAVNAEILVEPLANGTFLEGPGTGADGIVQRVEVSGVDASQDSFDWTETTPLPAGLQGFDVVSIKAGNGRTMYVYQPDSTGDTNLSDLNTTQKITSVLFCADDNVTIVDGGALCDIPSGILSDLCAAAGGSKVVEIFTPGSPETQICACPGVTFNICNPHPVCDPDTADCTTDFPGGFCNPASPDNPDSTLTETSCCLLSPFTELPLVSTSVPVGTSTSTGSGSFCSTSTTTSAGGGATSFQFCF